MRSFVQIGVNAALLGGVSFVRLIRSVSHSFVVRWEALAFFYTQRIKGFDVPSEPRLDEGGRQYFLNCLDRCKFYLEYGSGGSTVEAARRHKRFITVESDRFFLEAVKRRIAGTTGNNDIGEYIYCNIGSTGPLGAPLSKTLTQQRLDLWRKYPDGPWMRIAAQNGMLPDLILIDGRFRVACALTTIKYLKKSASFEMLVDDYANRPHYGEIERFAKLSSMQGRMAVFTPAKFDMDDLNRSLTHYVLDWR